MCPSFGVIGSNFSIYLVYSLPLLVLRLTNLGLRLAQPASCLRWGYPPSHLDLLSFSEPTKVGPGSRKPASARKYRAVPHVIVFRGDDEAMAIALLQLTINPHIVVIYRHVLQPFRLLSAVRLE